MKVEVSGVPGVAIYGQESPEFSIGLCATTSAASRTAIVAALPFSVVLKNGSERAVALTGVRFDMVAPSGKPCSVVHYADTLRKPEDASFRPGTWKFVCAEPAFTVMVNCGLAEPGIRGRMNVENLSRMLQMRASLDCVAFENGEFAGPDTDAAFGRLAGEREAEAEFLKRVLDPLRRKTLGALLRDAERSGERGLRTLVRKLCAAFGEAGEEQTLQVARQYRLRISLRKSVPPPFD